MLKRFYPLIIVSVCSAIMASGLATFLSPVWLPLLADVAVGRPTQSTLRNLGMSAVETSGPNRSSRTRTTELNADSRGHFEAHAQINGHGVGVMIDTGATSVALRFEDAARLGLHAEPDQFNIPIATANGATMAARAMLAEIRIGNIRVKNVEALIVPAKALTTNLMGMSFLKRLSRVQIAGSRLVLEE
jgi:aspartyl protease family protein